MASSVGIEVRSLTLVIGTSPQGVIQILPLNLLCKGCSISLIRRTHSRGASAWDASLSAGNEIIMLAKTCSSCAAVVFVVGETVSSSSVVSSIGGDSLSFLERMNVSASW